MIISSFPGICPLSMKAFGWDAKLLRLHSGLANETSRCSAIVFEKARKLLWRVEHGFKTHIDQPPLPKVRIAADRREFIAQLVDDRLRGFGRRDDAEIKAREAAAVT